MATDYQGEVFHGVVRDWLEPHPCHAVVFSGQELVVTENPIVHNKFERLERIKVVEALGIELVISKKDVRIRGPGFVVEIRPGGCV